MAGKIRALAKLRHDLGIHRGSKLEILVAQDELYAAKIDGKTVMKLGGASWSPGDGWKLRADGPRYAVWSKE